MCSQQLNPGDIMAIYRTHGGTRQSDNMPSLSPSSPSSPPSPLSLPPIPPPLLPSSSSTPSHFQPSCHQSQLMKTSVRYIHYHCRLGSPCMFVSCLQQKSPSTPRVKTYTPYSPQLALTQLITTSHPCSWVPGQRLGLLKATKNLAKA